MGILSFLKKEQPAGEVMLPINDSAWSENSLLYSVKDFEKYNPDDLIGTKGYGIYKRMMEDEQVKAVVRFKRDAITSRDYFFELDYDRHNISREQAMERIALAETYLEQMKGSFSDKLNNIMSAIYNGYSMTEKLYKFIEFNDKTYWGIQDLKLKPYDTLYFKVDEFSNVLKLIQKHEGKEQELDLARFIHYIHNPDYDEHYGGSELREAYRAWFSKDKIIKFRNIWLERHAGGFRWLQPSANSNAVLRPGSAEYLLLQDVLSRTQTATSAIFPKDMEYNVSYPQNQVAWREAIEDYDLAISRALLVPNLMGITPSGQTGSYSQSETQMEAFFWTLNADAARLEDALNEQLFKELHEANFGDGAMPLFRFKPASEKKKMEVIKAWNELITSGAAKHSQQDEAHLRSMLEFPELPEEEDDSATTTPPESALNGAQVTAMVDILIKVRDEDISAESAKHILTTAFPINLEQAEAFLKDIPEKKEPVIPPGLPANDPGNNLPNQQQQQQQPDDKQQKPQFTIAFQQAMKRVDFAVIGKKSEDMVSVNTDDLARTMDAVVRDAVTRIKLEELGTREEDAEKIVKFRLDGRLVAKVRKAVKSMLSDAWNLGDNHARNEVDKARGEFFTADSKRLSFISAQFFDLESFTITGKLTDDALNTMKNILLNGARTGKSIEDIVRQIYKTFASQGMISIEEARDALGEALGVANPDARLRTIVRTNTFKAINEARYSYFTDPELNGFVEALEYTAILDSRTTQVCKHLDGKVHGIDSEVWDSYRPPNHFNCRSLLIPVTQVDAWKEDDYPELDPQGGFE